MAQSDRSGQDGNAGADEARPKITNACEACRSSKVRCQPSSEPGICRRCLESRRECVFKSGPRTRRPRRSRSAIAGAAAVRRSPPPGPSKTFTIDIPIRSHENEDAEDALEQIRSTHEAFLEDLVPLEPDHSGDEDADSSPAAWPSRAASLVSSSASSMPVGASAFSTPPSSHTLGSKSTSSGHTGKTTMSLSIRPQFNVDSAAALLNAFRGHMLVQFPCLYLSSDATPASLSRESPFLLLALLAAASSVGVAGGNGDGAAGSIQGHGLYDEEFRKVLGLKFVSSGETTIEMLMGLVVYCAWYPFHLRPKQPKLALQYMRMMSDIVRDLELDQPTGYSTSLVSAGQPANDDILRIRTMLSCHYLVSMFSTAWGKVSPLSNTAWMATCCTVLEQANASPGDSTLAWLVRLENIVDEANALRLGHRGSLPVEYRTSMILKGLEIELEGIKAKMPTATPQPANIKIALVFTELFLVAGPILKITRPPARSAMSSDAADQNASAQEASRLMQTLPLLRQFFEYVLTLTQRQFAAFGGADWARVILCTILGFRASFPLPEIGPAWDHDRWRAELNFGSYLERFCDLEEDDTPGRGRVGKDAEPCPYKRTVHSVLTGMKVVLEILKRKYDKRLLRLNSSQSKSAAPLPVSDPHLQNGMAWQPPPPLFEEPQPVDRTMSGCPMLDPGIDKYFQFGDDASNYMNLDFSGASLGMPLGLTAEDLASQGYHDLWTTMTLDWAAQHGNTNATFDDV